MRVSRLFAVALSLATVSCGGSSPSAPGATAPQQSMFAFVSQPGDIVGGGQTYKFSAETATFRTVLYDPESVVIEVNPNDRRSWWRVWMRVPEGQQLQVGTYVSTGNWSYQTTGPQLMVDGNGAACIRSEGQFAIRELVRGTPIRLSTGAMVGPVERLHVLFSHRCTETSAPGLTGELWYIAPQ